MKQIINFKSFWDKFKLAMYAAMVIVTVTSIPVLSYMELAHTEKQVQITKVSIEEAFAKHQAKISEKQS